MDPHTLHLKWMADPGALLLGYKEGELDVQLPILRDVVLNSDRTVLEEALERLTQGHVVKEDIRLRRRNGEFCWVQLCGGSIAAGVGQVKRIAGVLRDVQDAYTSLNALYEERRMESVGNIASGIAHEFNNLLTPISGYIEMSLDQLGENHSLSPGLRTAQNRVRYAADLVSQIQTYGRKSMLARERVNLKRLIPPSLRMSIASFPDVSNRISVRENWPPDLPDVWADRGQLQQALRHLFRNAIEAMPEGGQLTTEAVAVNEESEPIEGDGENRGQHAFVRIRVIDTGKGINAADLPRIFDPFFTTHGRALARGMGLPTVEGMAVQHGGRVEVKSEEGAGSEVALYLPTRSKGIEVLQQQVDADGTMKVERAALPDRLLVADDEAFIRRLIQKIFHAEGWKVDEASNYDEVVRQVEEKGAVYSLIILDLTMPGHSAEKGVELIRRVDPNVQFLFVSGFSRDERVDRLIEEVGGSFMNKPFSPSTLLTTVDQLAPL